jgi:uncharacterized protein (TIGR02271 family)
VTARFDRRWGERRRGLSAGRAIAVGAVLATVARVTARVLQRRSDDDRAPRAARKQKPRSGEPDRVTRTAGKQKPRSGAERVTRTTGKPKARSGAERATRPTGKPKAPSGEPDRATRAAGKRKPDVGSGDAMTRSEEELEVRTVRRRRSRVRLRKYLVTEEVQRTIPLRREEIRIEEEPISNEDADRPAEDANVPSEDEIVLYKEIPVIEKRVVPAERVRVVKDVRADEAQVSERLRKERIDVETDPER